MTREQNDLFHRRSCRKIENGEIVLKNTEGRFHPACSTLQYQAACHWSTRNVDRSGTFIFRRSGESGIIMPSLRIHLPQYATNSNQPVFGAEFVHLIGDRLA